MKEKPLLCGSHYRPVAELQGRSSLLSKAMSTAVPPYIDARQQEAPEPRTALIQLDELAVCFTATWGRASSLVPRPDGAYRRLLFIRLLVPTAHQKYNFERVRTVTLFLDDRPCMFTDDLDGVYARDLTGVTLAVYVDDRH